jgi:hypothetical protein
VASNVLAFGFLKVFWIFTSLLPTGWVFGYWIRFFGILVVLQDKLDNGFSGFWILPIGKKIIKKKVD